MFSREVTAYLDDHQLVLAITLCCASEHCDIFTKFCYLFANLHIDKGKKNYCKITKVS